jgi:prolyl oligopeptidase
LAQLSAGGKPLRTKAFLLVAIFVWMAAGARAQQAPAPAPPPRAPVRAVSDSYFGATVADPYRYMENLKDPAVASWMKAQNDYARAMLARIPGRERLLERVRELDATVTTLGGLFFQPNRYFYLAATGRQNTLKLYARDLATGRTTLLVDPDKLAPPGGPAFAINYFVPSFDGRYVAYGISQGGSENAAIRIVDVATGKSLPETIPGARFGVSGWRPDGRSFFYNRLQKLPPNAPATAQFENSRIYLHVLGSDPAKDVPVFGQDVVPGISFEPGDIPSVSTIPGSIYAIGTITRGVKGPVAIYETPIASAGRPHAHWQKLFASDKGVPAFTWRGNDLYIVSEHPIYGGFVVRITLRGAIAPKLDLGAQLPAEADPTGMIAARDALYLSIRKGGTTELLRMRYDQPDRFDRVNVPPAGTLHLLDEDPRVEGALLWLSSWNKAPRVFHYDPASGRLADTKLIPAGPYDDPADLTAVETTAFGTDGALVPLTILYKRGMRQEANNPTLLIGYGSYDLALEPSFSPLWLAWFDQGGIVAIAHVRGGGGFSGFWRFEGLKWGLQNRFRDFLTCAQYLIDQQYTSPDHLAVLGGSAGGIVVGRAITERPNLFGAAIIQSGVLDMLRFENTANGVLNVAEFGSVKTETGFRDLYGISAYHHVRDGVRYPAVLLEAGMNDPRVDPWQSAKMAARLEAATTSGRPVLLRIDYEAGHGFGSTMAQAEQQLTDEFSFLFWQLGVAGFQPAAEQVAGH